MLRITLICFMFVWLILSYAVCIYCNTSVQVCAILMHISDQRDLIYFNLSFIRIVIAHLLVINGISIVLNFYTVCFIIHGASKNVQTYFLL